VKEKGMVMACVEVSDGGIQTPDGESPAFVSLRVDIPINKQGRGEPAIPDMLVAMNPMQQAQLEKLMAGVKQ
jgi:hypothetical protein